MGLLVGYGIGYGCAWKHVEKICGSGEGFILIMRWHAYMNEKRVNHVVKCPKHAFSLAICGDV